MNPITTFPTLNPTHAPHFTSHTPCGPHSINTPPPDTRVENHSLTRPGEFCLPQSPANSPLSLYRASSCFIVSASDPRSSIRIRLLLSFDPDYEVLLIGAFDLPGEFGDPWFSVFIQICKFMIFVMLKDAILLKFELDLMICCIFG